MNETNTIHRQIVGFLLTLFCIVLFVPAVQSKDFTFTWTANSEQVDGYRLYYKSGPAGGIPYDGTGATEGNSPINTGNVTTFTLHGLSETENHFFTLTAYIGDEESDFAPELSWMATPAENQPPTASNLSLSTDENTPVTGQLQANDPDGDTLTFLMATNPTMGNVTIGETGAFTYTPDQGQTGTDSFTFKVNDGTVDSQPATVTININAVNLPPTASEASFSTSMNSTVNGQLQAEDPDGDSLTFALETEPTLGNATISASGVFSYTPDQGQTGTDSFTFKVNDGTVDSQPATVSININAVNQPPTANNVVLLTSKNTAINGQLQGEDPDGDPLSYSLVTDPSKGTVTISANGIFSYSPRQNETGTDSFTFKVNDGTADSAPATVTITIDATTAGVSFSWDPHESEIDGYRIYYKTGTEGGPEYDGIGIHQGDSPIDVGLATNFTLTGLQLDTTYFFTITVFRGQNESGYAAEIRYRPGAPPAPEIIFINKVQ